MSNIAVKVVCFSCAFGIAVAACAAAQDQPPKPKQSKTQAQAPAAKTAGKDQAPTPQAASPGGVLVFADPVTRQIRQPTPAEIGTLSPPVIPATLPAPTTFQGPGGAVGIKLDGSSMSYVVVTKAPDGKLATECVTGDKTTATRAAAHETPKTETPKTKAPSTAK